MTMLSPAATYHAELREQLGHVARALSVQRAMVWLARGLAAGTVVVLGLVIWAWARDAVSTLPLPLLLGIPIAMAIVVALGSMLLRHDTPELARRVDRAARLQERSTTALELGAKGHEFPLALAQMRDAVEHLKRVEMLEVFPLRLPRRELMTTFFVGLVAVLIGISPNPWLLRARASNPAISIAREQAQRVQRLADSMPVQDSTELDHLRQLVSKGARTIDARSNEPDAALNALQDLEDQVRQMSAGDDQLASALAAIASALAADPATQQLSQAINTGDLREIARATRDLAQQSGQLSGQDQQRVAKVLRNASDKAGRSSQSVAGELGDAADALAADASGSASSDPANMSAHGQQNGASAQSGARSQNRRSASDALNQLSQDAAAAAERQRTQSQLESSRNALERALGRTQSRSGSSSTGRSSSSSSQRSQGNGAQSADSSQSGGQGQADGSSGGSPGDGSSDPNGSGSQSGGEGSNGDTGNGGGFSTGGQNQNRTGGVSNLDTITRPEQVPSSGAAVPDQSSQNPYLGDAGSSTAQASDEAVQPTFSRKTTQGNDTASIPLGLRDLVKDYFSSLDQK